MAILFGRMRRRILIFRTKSSFTMYKWHVSTDTAYFTSLRCVFFDKQDFISDVENENFMIFRDDLLFVLPLYKKDSLFQYVIASIVDILSIIHYVGV